MKPSVSEFAKKLGDMYGITTRGLEVELERFASAIRDHTLDKCIDHLWMCRSQPATHPSLWLTWRCYRCRAERPKTEPVSYFDNGNAICVECAPRPVAKTDLRSSNNDFRRDIAARVMAAMCTADGDSSPIPDWDMRAVAVCAWRAADALIATESEGAK